MNKKGFTLVELLAVIVILAIIALIATPIILNIIEDAKEESDERSVELYAKAIQNSIAKSQLNSNEEVVGEFTTDDGKTLEQEGKTPITVEYDGAKVVCETIMIYEDGNVYLGCIVNGGEKGYTYGKEQPTETAKACTYVDEDNSGTINLSDTVTCGTESFHVMSNDGNNITMLSMHNLNVGDNAYPEGTIGIQNENVVGGLNGYGTIAFSEKLYWESDITYPAFVYNENSKLYPYVSAYETYLKENGVSSARATLMSYEQATALGCDGNGSDECSYAPTWVYSTGYWTGSAYSFGNVWSVNSDASFGDLTISRSDRRGVRPVITISVSELQ